MISDEFKKHVHVYQHKPEHLGDERKYSDIASVLDKGEVIRTRNEK